MRTRRTTTTDGMVTEVTVVPDNVDEDAFHHRAFHAFPCQDASLHLRRRRHRRQPAVGRTLGPTNRRLPALSFRVPTSLATVTDWLIRGLHRTEHTERTEAHINFWTPCQRPCRL